jgi:hypothetical protein
MAVATITLNKSFFEYSLQSSILITASYTGSTSTIGEFSRACSGLRSTCHQKTASIVGKVCSAASARLTSERPLDGNLARQIVR